MEYETRAMSLMVLPKGQPIYSEMATTITIVDEAAGEFVEVEQSGRTDVGKIAIAPCELPALRNAIDRLIGECRQDSRKEK